MTPVDVDGAAACAAPTRAERHEPHHPPTISLDPASAYEAVTRQMVIALSEDLREIKARLNGLLFMVAGSLLLDVALRLSSQR